MSGRPNLDGAVSCQPSWRTEDSRSQNVRRAAKASYLLFIGHSIQHTAEEGRAGFIVAYDILREEGGLDFRVAQRPADPSEEGEGGRDKYFGVEPLQTLPINAEITPRYRWY